MYINIYHASCPTLESVSRRPTPHNSVQPHEAVTRAIGKKKKKLNARDDEQEEQSIGGVWGGGTFALALRTVQRREKFALLRYKR